MCCVPPPPDRSSRGPSLSGTRGILAVLATFALLAAAALLGPSACSTPRGSGAAIPTAAGRVEGALPPTQQPSPTASTAQLSLESQPAGAAVAVDGIERGKTPEPTPSPVPVRTGPIYPLAVMVENLIDSRPQSGLARADVVYEALVEGGITRFMAVYVDGQSETIGPVRSARHYYVYLAAEYNASYVHIGASPEGYEALDATGVVNLDETYGDPGFWRVRTRYAPHNAYTSTDLLRSSLEKVRRVTPGGLAGFKFRTDGKPLEGQEAKEITIDYSTSYRVKYRYSPEDRLYLRFMDGLPHRDAETDEQVAPRNLVIQFVGAWVIDSDGRLDMAQVGKGKALYFQDGVVTEGSWRKPSLGNVTEWYDSEEKPLLFNPGKIWVQIVPPGTKLEY